MYRFLASAASVAIVFGLAMMALSIIRAEEPLLWVGGISLLAGAIAQQFVPDYVLEYDEAEADADR